MGEVGKVKWVKCSSRQDAFTDMRLDLLRSIRDLDLS